MEGVIFSSIFWGGILIVWGLLTIINGIWNLHIPTFSIIVAFVLIYVGIMILTGGFKVQGKVDTNMVLFSEAKIAGNPTLDDQEYNVIFGKGTIDLNQYTESKDSMHLRIHTVFGESVVILNPNLPIKIIASSAFGSITLPDQTVTAFGRQVYKSPNYSLDKKHIDIEADVAFGVIRFEGK